jgi:hypothetical protein
MSVRSPPTTEYFLADCHRPARRQCPKGQMLQWRAFHHEKRAMSALGQTRSFADVRAMSASLIGHSGSSAFRLSTATVSMSLAGSCFSSESAPGPFHHGIRRRGGTIFTIGLAVRRTVGPSGHANSPHPSSREGHHSTARWSRVSFYWISCCTVFMLPPRLVPGSSGTRCRQPRCGA